MMCHGPTDTAVGKLFICALELFSVNQTQGQRRKPPFGRNDINPDTHFMRQFSQGLIYPRRLSYGSGLFQTWMRLMLQDFVFKLCVVAFTIVIHGDCSIL